MKIPKISAMAGLAAIALSVTPLHAQPDTSGQPTRAASAVTAGGANPVEFDKQLAQMQKHMKQMQTQMDRIAQSRDPQERQRLLQEHWDAMQEAMTGMRGIWGHGACCTTTPSGMGPGMMMNGPMMGWGHMHGYYNSLTPEQIRQRQYMMDQYMPMQQMMMEHMMWHQRWTNIVAPPAPRP
ncbi:hypothetical protein [Roseateles sp.]|uniref:hypothetical protein n=1 Tax=Roseateles sp. TaxID=1971397 RepID=UPI003D0FC439